MKGNWADSLADVEVLDRVVDPVQRVVEEGLLADERRRRLLRGEWLGHPLHPLLTDLPIGFWTSAFVLDLGGRRTRLAADLMVAAGLACVPATVASGLTDWSERERGDRRIGIVHAAANTAATLCYAASLWSRVRGRRGRGVALGMAGAGAATLGGYLGGHLTFAR